MLTIDGAQGEGGGQVLRTALALSLCLGTPFRIVNIRARRKNPGLMPQHLAAVRAAATVAAATVAGAEIGSLQLQFEPQRVAPGEYAFTIGTAGSTTLLLQTVLPALLTAPKPSRLILEGGTHNPLAPPFEFLAEAFLPLVNRMGPRVIARLVRPGFYPAGGGRIEVDIVPASRLHALHLTARGAIVRRHACATLAHLPEHIAKRELRVLQDELGLRDDETELRGAVQAYGPGNIVTVTIVSEHVTEVFAAFGTRGVTAETVARAVAAEARRYMTAGVPVGTHLADQLLLPLALAGSGAILTLRPTNHTLTNISVLNQFLSAPVEIAELGDDAHLIRVGLAANEPARID